MTANFSKEILKSALIELAQSDRVFFVSLIADLMQSPEQSGRDMPKQHKSTKKSLKNTASHTKINPPYRKNVEQLRKQYAMDKSVLLKLQDLFADAPSVETFLQTKQH